jgi:hypothetical protein
VDKNYAAVMALANRSVVLVKGRVVFAGESRRTLGQRGIDAPLPGRLIQCIPASSPPAAAASNTS